MSKRLTPHNTNPHPVRQPTVLYHSKFWEVDTGKNLTVTEAATFAASSGHNPPPPMPTVLFDSEALNSFDARERGA